MTTQTAQPIIADVKTHNGTITVASVKTGEHRTFKITTQAEDADFAPGERVVALLSGPDNTSDYRPFGFVKGDRGVRVWRKYWDTQYDKLGRMLNKLESHIEAGRVVVNFEGRCRVCNRPLTTPESASLGIGPVCSGKA